MLDITVVPLATLVIMLIAVTISFLNMGINRLLITRICGWEEYKVMRKETSEYQSQLMQAMRANDTKRVEKLRKKESQIRNMQSKMMKPQMILFPISMSYIVIWWFFLIPTFGANAVAVLPGLAPTGIPLIYWYMICSFFFGTLASRIIGVTPIA
ncbi:hypothetical protein AC478_02320 [miscellaneous Crenarchaeota group-1 archaeon SG8-32-3]|uniref:DUF106 domain-containing protein n=1 Tax=miscellaneous Crenarchaeota group-1 archaeon SG8-32-3 TaxID=1685125 RepID=A0A0M0BT18_9ARCH|nr:MAG: hypothetical protein AC478_02320 [miscellaneous Crenarchaeota group-1 archaeon SG8-32-3]